MNKKLVNNLYESQLKTILLISKPKQFCLKTDQNKHRFPLVDIRIAGMSVLINIRTGVCIRSGLESISIGIVGISLRHVVRIDGLSIGFSLGHMFGSNRISMILTLSSVVMRADSIIGIGLVSSDRHLRGVVRHGCSGLVVRSHWSLISQVGVRQGSGSNIRSALIVWPVRFGFSLVQNMADNRGSGNIGVVDVLVWAGVVDLLGLLLLVLLNLDLFVLVLFDGGFAVKVKWVAGHWGLVVNRLGDVRQNQSRVGFGHSECHTEDKLNSKEIMSIHEVITVFKFLTAKMVFIFVAKLS